jgi:hypothetical protein
LIVTVALVTVVAINAAEGVTKHKQAFEMIERAKGRRTTVSKVYDRCTNGYIIPWFLMITLLETSEDSSSWSDGGKGIYYRSRVDGTKLASPLSIVPHDGNILSTTLA